MNQCYTLPETITNHKKYEELRNSIETKFEDPAIASTLTVIVPKKSARCIFVEKGSVLRMTCVDGPQAGDVNFWNAKNYKEHFFTGKTRQLHRSHLSLYDKLWSCFPYLNPMATIVGDSIQYGLDDDGGGIHDVIGTRCDPFTHSLLSGGTIPAQTCHQNLINALEDFLANSDLDMEKLVERSFKSSNSETKHQILDNIKQFRGEFNIETCDKHVHDVLNIFMLSGFTRDEGKYFVKPSPAKKGDYIDLYAEMDLIVGLSSCPQGDVSIPCGKPVPDDICLPLKMEVITL